MTHKEKEEIYSKLSKEELIKLLIDSEERNTIQYVPIWQYIPTTPYPPLYPVITFQSGELK